MAKDLVIEQSEKVTELIRKEDAGTLSEADKKELGQLLHDNWNRMAKLTQIGRSRLSEKSQAELSFRIAIQNSYSCRPD